MADPFDHFASDEVPPGDPEDREGTRAYRFLRGEKVPVDPKMHRGAVDYRPQRTPGPARRVRAPRR